MPNPDPSSATDSPPQNGKDTPINSSEEIDKTFYTWSTLFKALTGKITPEEHRSYLQTKDLINEEDDCKRCEKNRDWLLQKSPLITFMRREIRDLGHDLNSDNMRCRRCTTAQLGGFDSQLGLLLCANELTTRSRLEETMAHEMVHAYDHLRWEVDPNNMKHQACTEIRATMLSGECRFMREFFGRRQLRFTEQFQECVRRRATASLMNRSQLQGDRQEASRIVNSVWKSCFSDTRPFDEIYR